MSILWTYHRLIKSIERWELSENVFHKEFERKAEESEYLVKKLWLFNVNHANYSRKDSLDVDIIEVWSEILYKRS